MPGLQEPGAEVSVVVFSAAVVLSVVSVVWGSFRLCVVCSLGRIFYKNVLGSVVVLGLGRISVARRL